MAGTDPYIDRLVARLRQSRWNLETWRPSAALFSKNGRLSAKFRGQPYDPQQYELVPDGWEHDHCPFCWATICDYPSEKFLAKAYTNGYDWVCPDCFATYLGSVNET